MQWIASYYQYHIYLYLFIIFIVVIFFSVEFFFSLQTTHLEYGFMEPIIFEYLYNEPVYSTFQFVLLLRIFYCYYIQVVAIGGKMLISTFTLYM